MARSPHGIMGPFSGKVGPVVGATWKGIPYIRAKPVGRTQTKSDKERFNQEKLANCHSFLKPLLKFLRVGFKGYTPTVEGYNAAKSYNLIHAFEGAPDEPKTLNPARIRVSHGDLPLPNDIRLSFNDSERQLVIEWTSTLHEYTYRFDQALIVAYDPVAGLADMQVLGGQFRHTERDVLGLRKITAGSIAHVYFAFMAADRSKQSNSVYLGAVQV
jgi:hypothetical protein